MEEEKVADDFKLKSASPLASGLPINWGLITGPVPEPVFPASSLGASISPPQSSAVHALQTKVRSLTQRRTRGRDREKERERPDTEPPPPAPPPPAHISSEALFRQRPRGKGPVPPPEFSWRSGAGKTLSSSDEEEEVEVQVRLQIHSPPVEARRQQALQGASETEDERPGGGFRTDRPRGPGAGTSLESLLSDNSSSGKEEPSPPPPLPVLSCSPIAASSSSVISAPSTSSPSSATKTRHWAPPKGFWRVARPETLLLNGVGPNATPLLPARDYTQAGAPAEPPQGEAIPAAEAGAAVDDGDASSEFKHSDSVDCYLDRYKHKEKEKEASDPGKGLCSPDSWEGATSQGGGGGGPLTAEEKQRAKQRVYARLKERQQSCREEREQSEESVSQHGDRADCEGAPGDSDTSDSAILAQELEPYLRSLLVVSDELPLSPRHEQAKRLLERARLKARSSQGKGERPCRRSHSDQRPPTVKKQQDESPGPAPAQKVVQTKEDLAAQAVPGNLLVPDQTDSPGDPAARSRRYGCSPTRVRFEDESEKEAESRYLDRVRQRGRPGTKSKGKENNADSERSKSHRGVSVPPPPRQDDAGVCGDTTTVVKEIIVLVKKCEACGSVVREPQPASSPSESPGIDPGNPEDPRGKPAPRWVPPNKPEASTRPKAPLTVTFAGAYVLGENREISTGWKSSGFGKLRRRSRKGESRLESGNGPYGPSWAQRRNSNPRNRVNMGSGVSFAPGSPVVLEPRLPEASGGVRESPPPSLPIKSALKSSSRSRSAAGQTTVQFQISPGQGGDGASQHLAPLDSPETRKENPVTSSQGVASASSPAPCIRPSTLKYSSARLTTDLQAAELWSVTVDGAGVGDAGSGLECRPALRGLALSRAEDLRAELLRAEHLKAEAIWEENGDGSRKLDGRPKLFLRRFFSSIGLNSVGRLVKGSRSSSMEQLSISPAHRAGSASASPTHRPPPTIQRTPSLQTLHTVLPLNQLRKASSVQSLERRTERTTILGEVQIPYGLAPSPDSPQLELHKAMSVGDILTPTAVRPVSRITQALPDGTLLLELIKPPNGPFGFIISRGKGRPDTGVYVERVGDGSGEGPYVGLLGIGDEILQVNGEAVAGLSLDQVTRLMTQESVASLRIMPARRNQR